MKKSVLFVLFALISVAGFSQITGAEFTKAWANELGGKIFPDEYAVATKIIEIHEEKKSLT